MDVPPPYYTTVAALQAENQDLSSTIRRLSNETIKLDSLFQSVYIALSLEENFDQSSATPSSEWKVIRELYTGLLWFARNTATKIKARTTDLVTVIIPCVAEPGLSREDKIAELKAFTTREAPAMLTTEVATDQINVLKKRLIEFSEKSKGATDGWIAAARAELVELEEKQENQRTQQRQLQESSRGLLGFFKPSPPSQADLVNYDGKIKQLTSNIESWEKHRGKVEDGIRKICVSLDTIPDQVGSAFSALWLHQNTDTEHLVRELESSADGTVWDIHMAASAYTQVEEALRYFGTNIMNADS